ncbi:MULTISPECIES: STAS domain-containing protein [unclassified Nocardioides]|uniref:STAS domain-containing protein n=1 Tax=unclassified Nocardioides TaxID=2615069 RepID=UPI00361A9A81
MEIAEHVTDRYVVLMPSGKFNLVSAPSAKTRIDALVAAGRPRIVVDLSGVDFIDSSGLGALIGALKSARQASGDVRIAAAGEQVQAVLALTNLNRILVPFETVEAAAHGW